MTSIIIIGIVLLVSLQGLSAAPAVASLPVDTYLAPKSNSLVELPLVAIQSALSLGPLVSTTTTTTTTTTVTEEEQQQQQQQSSKPDSPLKRDDSMMLRKNLSNFISQWNSNNPFVSVDSEKNDASFESDSKKQQPAVKSLIVKGDEVAMKPQARTYGGPLRYG